MIWKRILWASSALALTASIAAAQTSPSQSGSSSSNGTATATASSTSASGTASPFTGSVATGKATSEVLKINFEDAIERGLKQNLGALLSSNSIESARGEKWKKLSDILPSLTTDTTETASQANLAQTGFTKIHAPGFSFSSISPIVGPFGFFDTRAYLSVPLLNINGWQNTRSANESLRASRYSYKDARELVVLYVGFNYLQTIANAARVETAEAQLKTAEALYNQASDRLKAGVSPAIDALRAKVEFQTRQQQLIAARNDYQKQRLALARTMGLPAGQSFELTETMPYDPPIPVTLDEALQRAYQTRSDFLAAQAQVRAAELAKRAAYAEYYPSVSFDGNYGVGGPVPDQIHGSFQAMGSLRVPIFQGNRVHADILQADATLANNKAQLENLRGQIDQDVRDALFDLQSSLDQVKVAKSNVDLASQTLDQARDRFVAGVTDNIEVVQAQEAVATANESEISSLFNYNNARILLARAQGIAETGVLQYLKGRSNGSTNGN
jgi:outer membrane protein TolC